MIQDSDFGEVLPNCGKIYISFSLYIYVYTESLLWTYSLSVHCHQPYVFLSACVCDHYRGLRCLFTEPLGLNKRLYALRPQYIYIAVEMALWGWLTWKHRLIGYSFSGGNSAKTRTHLKEQRKQCVALSINRFIITTDKHSNTLMSVVKSIKKRQGWSALRNGAWHACGKCTWS